MASYIDTYLNPGESVTYRARLSLWRFALLIVIGVLAIPLFGLGILILAYVYIQVKTTEIAITNKRTIAKFGWIRRSTIEMYNLKIESIQVEQGVIGRLFNFGSIILSGAGNPQAPIPGIANPMSFRRALLQQTAAN